MNSQYKLAKQLFKLRPPNRHITAAGCSYAATIKWHYILLLQEM